MNKKSLTALFITGSLLASPVIASNFFQKFTSQHSTKKMISLANSKHKSSDGSSFTDFSGTWVGKCNNMVETDTLILQNTDREITLNGRDFEIGALETESTSNQNNTSFAHLFFSWNSDHSNLEFKMAFSEQIHKQDINDKLLMGFGKGSMYLQDGQLIIEADIKTTEGNDTAICSFTKQ